MTVIDPSEILFKLSAPSATAGNTVMGLPGVSLGNFISTIQVSAIINNNIFSDITGAENAGNQVDYACIFIHNNTSTGNAMVNTIAWLPSAMVTPGGATLAMAADPAGISILNSNTQQAAVISAPTNPPAGVSGWVSPVSDIPVSPSYTGGLQLGTIQPGYTCAVWIRRTVADVAALDSDTFEISVFFSSAG